ncbi:hypothetical protein BJ165DRAFT_1531951 [Panaeolus papilionaceus]|nr:hypothetical protein BJ165DRAFT_1531951 [Panaeolus papilionaceus]
MTADPLARDSQPTGVLAKIGSVLDKIFFSAKAKLVVLRLLLLSILVNLGIHLHTYTEAESREGWYRSYTRGVSGYLVFTFIHHVLSVFVTSLIPRLLDFLLILMEIPLVVLTFIEYPYQYNALGATFAISVVGIFLDLFLLLIFRLAAIIRHGGKNLLKAFDIVEDRKREKVFPETRLPLALSLLLGRSIWRRQFLGEGVFVRLARGVLAWGLVLLFVIYGLLTDAIKPALESMFVPMLLHLV